MRLATNKPFMIPRIAPKILSKDFVNLLILESFPARNIPAKYITRNIITKDIKFNVFVSLMNLFSTNAKPEWNLVASTIPMIMLMSAKTLTRNPFLYPKNASKRTITNIIISSVFNMSRKN